MTIRAVALDGSNFNPHFREGSDRSTKHMPFMFTYFNPHFREGSDIDFNKLASIDAISIHTSAKEVTQLDN